jgi:hypothetical protein
MLTITGAFDHLLEARPPIIAGRGTSFETPRPRDARLRCTTISAGFVDQELKDRAQPACQSIRACRGLRVVLIAIPHGGDAGIDDQRSWVWACIHCIPSSQLRRLRPRATCRCHSYSTSHLAVWLVALSVSNAICSKDSSKSAAKYVSITLSSSGSTAMSSGKSSTTSQAGSRCFAVLARTRRADCAERSDGWKPARYRRP